MDVYGDLCHDTLAKKIKPKKSYSAGQDYAAYKRDVKKDLYDFLCLDNIKENACEPAFQIESEEKKDGYTIIRFSFYSEVDAKVPCYLLIPDTGKKKYPLCITLQGHSTGFHNSIGVPIYENDEEYIKRGAFALQAVEKGFAALALEQRGLGERKSANGFDWRGCDYQSSRAKMMGRTILGERVWDVQRAMDIVAEKFPVCDMEKIALMGSSGGGTATYYVACMDERVKLAAASCAFCTFKHSILSVYHCPCNYVPNMILSYEMQDFSCLIAPRNFLVLAGVEDNIFPFEGVQEAYATTQTFYEIEGVKDKCRLVPMPKGHYFCKEIVWDAIEEEAKKLGWL